MNRGYYRKVVHLYGDSIFRGWGLGNFRDQLPDTYPLISVASIWDTLNWAMSNFPCPDYVWYAGTPPTPDVIRASIKAGQIRPGDVVVFEDAGNHNMNPDAYEAQWSDLRAAVTDRHPITAVFMTMFDYDPAAPDCRFSTIFGTRSMNDATRAAATADKPYPGQTLLIEAKAEMDAFKANTWGQDLIPAIHPDGIHPTVWGQTKLAGMIGKAAGIRGQYSSYAFPNLESVISTNWQNLAYGSPYFSAGRAVQYLRSALLD